MNILVSLQNFFGCSAGFKTLWNQRMCPTTYNTKSLLRVLGTTTSSCPSCINLMNVLMRHAQRFAFLCVTNCCCEQIFSEQTLSKDSVHSRLTHHRKTVPAIALEKLDRQKGLWPSKGCYKNFNCP